MFSETVTPVLLDKGFTDLKPNLKAYSNGYPTSMSEDLEQFSAQGVSLDSIIASLNPTSKVCRAPTDNVPSALLSKPL